MTNNICITPELLTKISNLISSINESPSSRVKWEIKKISLGSEKKEEEVITACVTCSSPREPKKTPCCLSIDLVIIKGELTEVTFILWQEHAKIITLYADCKAFDGAIATIGRMVDFISFPMLQTGATVTFHNTTLQAPDLSTEENEEEAE